MRTLCGRGYCTACNWCYWSIEALEMDGRKWGILALMLNHLINKRWRILLSKIYLHPFSLSFRIHHWKVRTNSLYMRGETDYNDYASMRKPRRIYIYIYIWPRRLTVFELIRESWKAYDNVRWHEPSGGLGLQRVSLGYPPPVYSRMFVYSIGDGKHSATQCQVVTVVPCVLICLPPEPLPSPSGVSADPLEYPGARETPEAHVSAPSFSSGLYRSTL